MTREGTAIRADTDARRLRSALEPIATLCYHAPPARAAYAAVGLPDFFPAYAFVRSSVLGTPDPDVVVAVFGAWEPGVIATSLAAARATCSLDDVRAAITSGVTESFEQVLAGVDADDVADVAVALRRGVDAADGTGRPLFAGWRAWTWPSAPRVALWRAATAWRELRGDSHLAACVAHGLTGLQANILNELHVGYPLGEFTATRYWSAQQVDGAAAALRGRGLLDGEGLSARGRALRDEIEDQTDLAVQLAMDALGDDLDVVVRRTEAWSQLIIERGWFPDDEQKRAAG